MIVDADPSTLTIYILEKEYRIVCAEHEREPLKKAAQYLDSKMKEIRAARTVVGAEAIAIMAALNISHDYTQCMENSDPVVEMNIGTIKNIRDKIETALLRIRNESQN